MTVNNLFALGSFALAAASAVAGNEVLPGYLTDPSAMKEAVEKEDYTPPERLQFPYFSTYYVKPTVTTEETVKIGFYVTDFYQSEIRFRDKSHVFAALIEFGREGEPARRLKPFKVGAGDGEFVLGRLEPGEWWLRAWAVDKARRESHRVFHKFRVVKPGVLDVKADQIYRMTAADLGKYGIRNDGDLGREVLVEAGPVPEGEKLKEGFERSLKAIDAYVKAHQAGKGAARPGYTVYKSAVNGVVEFHG